MTLVKQTQTQLQTQLDFFENALVFVERNLDKNHLEVFPAFKRDSPLLRSTRTIDLEVEQSPDSERTSQIVIEPTTKQHSYNSETAEIYVALIILWRERGCPTNPEGWSISLSELCNTLKCSRNARKMNAIKDQLKTLKYTNTTCLLYTSPSPRD